MGFKRSKYKTVDDYKKSVQQDMVVLVNTVHDEIDYLIDGKLLKPILKKVSNISTLKKTINKLGLPYLNFLFDIEFDKYNSWTSKEALNVYEVAGSKYELEAMNKLKSIKGRDSDDRLLDSDNSGNSDEDTIEEVIIDGGFEKLDELINAIQNSVDKGEVRFGIEVDGEVMYYKNLVSKKVITKFL